jgi:hypothetical protein
MVVTDGDGRVLFCSPTRPGSCADITHARRLGLVELLAPFLPRAHVTLNGQDSPTLRASLSGEAHAGAATAAGNTAAL